MPPGDLKVTGRIFEHATGARRSWLQTGITEKIDEDPGLMSGHRPPTLLYQDLLNLGEFAPCQKGGGPNTIVITDRAGIEP